MPLSSMVAGARPAISSATKMPWAKPRCASWRPGHDVADGIHARDAGAQALVGRHEAAVDGDAGLLVAEALGHGPAPDGHEQQVGLDRLVPYSSETVTTSPCCVAPANRDAGLEGDLALAERALQLPC